MRQFQTVSAKRQALIDEFDRSPVQPGETITVMKKYLHRSSPQNENYQECKVIEVMEDTLVVVEGDDSGKRRVVEPITIKKSEVGRRAIFRIGANPFNENNDHVRYVAFSLESIITSLDLTESNSAIPKNRFFENGIEIKELNWYPFVFDKDGTKLFYQRPFVWALQDKQLLIESIYQGIDCGRVLIRKRSFEEIKKQAAAGATEFAFKDIVDGKQRLNAVREFILGDFPDLNGNYWGDLSISAQQKFINNQLLAYAEMPEDTKDEDVIKQFLKANFTGVSMSKGHIEYVKSIALKM